ncbi:MAG: TetR/AcrR family transcriptional regulator [Pseudomonadota bacterium]
MTKKSAGRPRSEQARAAILQSAFELLEEGGITRVTIEAVAANAKVGKPTIYRYWANAQELAMAAVMEQPADKQLDLAGMEPVLALKTQLQTVVSRFATSSGKQATILMASAQPESELSKAFRNQVILKSREEGRFLVEEIMAADSAQNGMPIDTILDMIYGPIFYRLLAGHAPLHDDFADEIVDTLFNPG